MNFVLEAQNGRARCQPTRGAQVAAAQLHGVVKSLSAAGTQLLAVRGMSTPPRSALRGLHRPRQLHTPGLPLQMRDLIAMQSLTIYRGRARPIDTMCNPKKLTSVMGML